MRVLSLTEIDRRKTMVLLEGEIAIILYRSELERYGIAEGGELSEKAYGRLVEELTAGRARERVLALLQIQSRTARQLNRRLVQDGYPPEVIERTMDFLAEYGLVNDRAFADNYIAVGAAKKSRRQLEYELREKGVGAEEIAAAFEAADSDETAAARAFLQKRLRGKTELSYEERGRLFAALGRKGFSGEVIRRVLAEAGAETEDYT